MMQKENAQYYYNISGSGFYSPRALLPYLEQKLLVADTGSIIVIDTTIFPPTSTDPSHTVLSLKDIE
jgi:hypothetical protein